MMRVRDLLLLSLSALSLVGAPTASGAAGAAGVDGFRDKLAKWVETRQLVSQEKSDWDAERETLRASRDLLQQQKKELQAQIAEFEASATQSDEERRDLLLQRGEYQRANAALAGEIGALEQQVKALVPRLPAPLQEKLKPLLVQIPEHPDEERPQLGPRLVNVLGVLAQAEKWNSAATLVGETRELDGGGKKVQVRTLYWGLGDAVYVDTEGEHAGIGRPGDDGWVFSDASASAADVKRLIDIYEGNVDIIRFVDLPVEIH